MPAHKPDIIAEQLNLVVIFEELGARATAVYDESQRSRAAVVSFMTDLHILDIVLFVFDNPWDTYIRCTFRILRFSN